MKRYRNLVAVGALTAFVGLGTFARFAQAWTYKTCNGGKVGWLSTNFFTINTFSYPQSSAQSYALFNGIAEWRKHTFAINNFGSINNSGSVSHGDGRSEAFLATQSALGTNVLGTTFLTYDGSCPFFWSTQNIQEADAAILNTLPMGEADESGFSVGSQDGGGRSVHLHEYGHGVGLDHATLFNNMRQGLPKPFVGGFDSHVQVLPDDAQGIRTLYNNQPANLVNLQASAQMLDSNNNVVNTAPRGTTNFCRSTGGTITMSFTVTNPGGTNLTFDQGFFINTTPSTFQGSGSRSIGGWFGATVNAFGVFTWQNVSFTIPANLPLGTYWVFHVVDPNHALSETTTNDNFVHNVLTIGILSC